MLTRALDAIEFSVRDAAPLVRRLLLAAGCVLIDTGPPDSSEDAWANTHEMAAQRIDEAVPALGYEARQA